MSLTAAVLIPVRKRRPGAPCPLNAEPDWAAVVLGTAATTERTPAGSLSSSIKLSFPIGHGAVALADLDSGATEQFPMEGYAVTKSWAQADPHTLRAFSAALEAGQRIADTDRSAVEPAYVALPQGAGHIDRVTAAVMALNTYPLGVNPIRLQRVADVMQQFGFLKRHFDIRQLLA